MLLVESSVLKSKNMNRKVKKITYHQVQMHKHIALYKAETWD